MGVAQVRDDFKSHLGRRYSPFIAHTGSCVRPNPSPRLRLAPYTEGPCRLSSVPAGRWPFPTLDLRVFPWMLVPVPRQSREVHLLVSSLTTSAVPEIHERVGDHKIFRSATSERGLITRPLLFLTFWPPSLLATPVAPTAVVDGSLIRSRRRGAMYACGPGACSGGSPSASLRLTGQPWRLLPSRTHVVAFMCIGYASRPIPSN